MDDSVFRRRMNRLAGAVEHSEEEGQDERAGALRCVICGHVWMPRSEKKPRSCPRCHSTMWDKEAVKIVRCMRCGHSWKTTDDHPIRCPSCRSKKWDMAGVDIVCKHCGAHWTDPLSAGTTLVCPSCGQSDRKGMTVSNKQRRCDPANVHVSLPMIWEMRKKTDDESKVGSLTSHGLSTTDAEIVVRFDRGMRVVPISRELDISLESVMAAVIPYIEACDSAGEFA